MSKNTLQIKAQVNNNVGYVYITDYIHPYSEASAQRVSLAMAELKGKDVQSLLVYINSVGGSCSEQVEITNELKKFQNVSVLYGAIGASAATRFACDFYAKAYPTSKFMIHKPSMNVDGNSDEIKSALVLLESYEDDYKNAYAAKTGKTAAEIEAIWGKGDVWMSAKKALEFGLIDELIESESKIEASFKGFITACANCGTEEQTIAKMDINQLKSALQMPADATEEQVLAKIKQNKDAAALVDQTQAKLVDDLVAKAISDKKITADAEASWKKMAAQDFDSTKEILAKMAALAPLSSGVVTPVTTDGLAYKTLDEYLDKDPAAYAKLKTEQPEVAAKLENEYFAKK